MSSMRDASILKAVAGVVREQVQKAYDALAARIIPIEAEVKALRGEVAIRPERGDRGEDGKSVTAEDVLPGLKALVADLVATIPAPKDGHDGKSVTIDDVQPVIERAALAIERQASAIIEKAIDRLPAPRDGRDGNDGADGTDGQDGKDADAEDVARKVIQSIDLRAADGKNIEKLCKELVASEVSRIPVPQDGRDGKDGEKGVDGTDGTDGRDGKDGEKGTDGTDGTDGRDGKDGESVTQEQLAEVVTSFLESNPPRDGTDGKSVTVEEVRGVLATMQAEWALDFEKRAQDTLQKAIDRMPKPKDGKDGIDFDKFDISLADDGRTVSMTYDKGERSIKHSLRFHHPLDRGVWKECDYLKGDGVTYGGSFWIAQKDNPKGKPGQFNRDWRLAVKAGRNGK